MSEEIERIVYTHCLVTWPAVKTEYGVTPRTVRLYSIEEYFSDDGPDGWDETWTFEEWLTEERAAEYRMRSHNEAA